MEPNTAMDDPEERENMSPKPVQRRWGCWACLSGCGCLIALPLIILFLAILDLILYGRIVDVENDSIPNIMQELAGEWIIEEERGFLRGNPCDMENWQETKLVLKEDGTCEFHNVMLYMTNPYGLTKERRTELTRKTLVGTWMSIPRHVTYSNLTENVYAAIRVRVFATEEHLIEQAKKSYIEPKDRPPFENEFAISLGLTSEWEHEVSANLGLGKESGGIFRTGGEYKLYWMTPDPDMSIGPVLKRVSL